MNCTFKRRLPIPQKLKEEYPLNDQMKIIKEERDKKIKMVWEGKYDKFLLIIGPCSADYEKPILEYVSHLRDVQDKVNDKIIIIPRVYTNKPRTKGIGYKGMLHQPNPMEGADLYRGICKCRELHMKVIRETGLTCSDEMLYPDNYSYFSDLLSYITIGARSMENQQHRMMASALDIPVGIKNPISGNLEIMFNSLQAAHHAHDFIYRGWEVESKGNPYAHAILRGGMNNDGLAVTNYHYEHLLWVHDQLRNKELGNIGIIVDTNHGNSNKQYLEQIRISKDVLESRRCNNDIHKMVKGLMIESYLEDGSQMPVQLQYGKSITDSCLGWEKTEKLIYEIADLL